jgi:hypothetical protein
MYSTKRRLFSALKQFKSNLSFKNIAAATLISSASLYMFNSQNMNNFKMRASNLMVTECEESNQEKNNHLPTYRK